MKKLRFEKISGQCQNYDGDCHNEEQKWIPVAESLPVDGRFVLCFMGDEDLIPFRILQWNSVDGRWDDGREWHYEEDVTHWMPLPEPPKEEINERH